MSKEVMQDMADYVKMRIGNEFGFVILIYQHGTSGRMNYVSNSKRQDVIEAMKEFIAKTEDAWGAHKL
jgi:hypothetical protein